MKTKKPLLILLAAALVLAASCFALVFGAGTTPGTDSDPIVSKSYVDAQMKELQDKIAALEKDVSGSGNTGSSGGNNASAGSETPAAVEVPVFKVVKVEAGESVIAGASAEIILRSGAATAIASASGGVADVTQGTDLSTGTSVSKNHLLLIPADDGRGIKCSTMSYVMVKGDYKIQ